jgi:hypothetical protein
MGNRLLALGLFLAVTLAPATALARQTQTRGDWSAVQALSPGEKISVKTKDGDRLDGRFESANDILIIFERRGRKVSLARDSIHLVQLDRGKSRKRGLLYGVLIGGGVGFAVGRALYFPFRDDKVGTTVPSTTAMGMAIGAGIGGGFGKGNKNETVYEAP